MDVKAPANHGRVPPHSTVVLLGSSLKLLLPKQLLSKYTVEDIINIFKFYVI